MFFSPLIYLFALIPVLVVGLIIFFVARLSLKRRTGTQEKDWYLQLTLSKEDAVSQFFFLLFLFFFGVTLLAFNTEFLDGALSWHSIILTTSIVGIVTAYYFNVVYALTFSLLGLISWWIAKTIDWIEMPAGEDIKIAIIFTVFSFIALLLYILGRAHEKELRWKRFALVYLVFGLLFVTGLLFVFSTQYGLGLIEEITKGGSFLGSWQIALSLLLLICFIVGAVIYGFSKGLLSAFEILGIFILTILFGAMSLVPEQALFIKFGGGLSSSGFLWAIIFNTILFFEILGIIFAGYKRVERWLINFGALLLFIFIFAKYFDWFFTFLNKSVFFISAGVLLFVVGWFMNKGRRYILANIKNNEERVS
ncbi:MAG: hypothetical protein AAB890_02265 [Patescibacteria group bacterium]